MIPNAPTDNLYKFVTFLGVALIAFSIWSLTESIKRRDVAILDQAKRVQIEALQDSAIQSKIKEIQAVQSKPTQDHQQKLADTTRLQLEMVLLTTQKLQDAMNNMQPELAVMQHEDDVQIYKNYSMVGLAMTVIGTLCWFGLHQRHQDALLRTQVEAAKTAKTFDGVTARPVQHPIWRHVKLRRRVHSTP